MGILHVGHIDLDRDVVEEVCKGFEFATNAASFVLKRSCDVYVWLGHTLPPRSSASVGTFVVGAGRFMASKAEIQTEPAETVPVL
jgi:hypothetical protein